MFSYGTLLIWAGVRGMTVQNCRVNWKVLTSEKLRFFSGSLRIWIVGEGLRASDLSGRVMAPSILFPPGSLRSDECDVGRSLFI